MDIPKYVSNFESQSPEQENYNQQLNLTLLDNLGNFGFVFTPITDADLRTTAILNPNTGEFSTVMDLAQAGAVWFVTDTVPPKWVGKQSDNPTVLVQIQVLPYP